MRRMDRETETQTVQVSGGRWGGLGGSGCSAWNKRDRSTGLTRPCYPGNSTGELCCCSRLHGDRSMCASVRVWPCVCARECEHECIKSNTGFHVGNNKVRGFTQLCRGLEIHRGSTFSSQRKVYAFSSEECQQP